MARHGKGQRGVEHRHIGVKLARDDAHFLIVVGGDDGDVGHFRSRAGSRRQERQRNAPARDLVHAVDVFERLRRIDQAGDDFRRVHGRAAAETDDAVGLVLARRFDGAFHHLRRRVRLDAVKQRVIEARRLKAFQRAVDQSRADDALVGDDEGALHARLHDLAETPRRAGFENDVGDGIESEVH